MRGKPPAIHVGPLLNKQPPASIEAEAAVLGSMILDHECIDEVCAIVNAEDFYNKTHAAIFGFVAGAYREHGRVDMVLVNQRIADAGMVDAVGGVQYLLTLAESVPSSASAGYYARIVRDKSRLRMLIARVGQVLHDCYHAPEGEQRCADDLIDKAQQAMFELSEVRSDEAIYRVHDLLVAVREDVSNRAETPGLGGITTGFHALDDALDGLHDGQMILVAARPSMGKTSLVTCMAENMAAADVGVALFSCEMSAKALAKRVLSSQSGVPANAMRRPHWSMHANDWQAMDRAVERMKGLPFYICDTPNLTLEELAARSRKLVARSGVRCVMVDYIQIMQAPAKPTREQEVSALSRGIKGLARSLRVPVVALSQLSRAAEDGEDPGMPQPKHLRDSGSLEQDADVVLMIHRPDYYRIRRDPEAIPDHEALIGIGKQREGAVGVVKLHFDAQRTRFGNWTQEDGRAA